jgi:hypothetical protein
MYKQMLFQTLGDEFRKFREFRKSQTLLCNFGKFNSLEKRLYRIRSAAGTLRISGKIGTFSDIFLEMSQILKKKMQKT